MCRWGSLPPGPKAEESSGTGGQYCHPSCDKTGSGRQGRRGEGDPSGRHSLLQGPRACTASWKRGGGPAACGQRRPTHASTGLRRAVDIERPAQQRDGCAHSLAPDVSDWGDLGHLTGGTMLAGLKTEREWVSGLEDNEIRRDKDIEQIQLEILRLPEQQDKLQIMSEHLENCSRRHNIRVRDAPNWGRR
ncbi:hypothetical protein NDU88_005981 [Pleurodeles waltl]|uniref:Uncharacterized protein n=1 Tax=Pleurodeles waltl TaxID=8319 RepID=A0AAV7N7D0_PLEWA|nr:hypothetical protein NDU88_005981 [Pleurodeles waltl]